MGAFVIKGGEIYDPAAQKWEKKDIAIENGMENKKVLKLTDFQKNEENPFMKQAIEGIENHKYFFQEL